MRTHDRYELQLAIEHFERGYVQNIMVLVRGNEEQAAKMLGIHTETLLGKLTRYDIHDVRISGDYS